MKLVGEDIGQRRRWIEIDEEKTELASVQAERNRYLQQIEAYEESIT
jgi:hypothetical protein